MLYVGTVIGINEVSVGMLGTVICGANSGVCPACHPSCNGHCDANNNCEQNEPYTRYYLAYKICLENRTEYGFGCASSCHASCTTCSGSGANQCVTCKATTATISASNPGTCVCGGAGFVAETSPTTECVPCINGSSYCLSGADTYSWKSAEAFQFAVAANSLGDSLPYLTTTHELLCYRINVIDVNDCTISALNGVDGIFVNGQPTPNQCYAILTAEWPYVEHWFTTLFPNFAAPAGASTANAAKVKTVLQLWILQFDPYFMQTDPAWVQLIAVFNSASTPWTTLLAWTHPTPKYSTTGSNILEFPTELSAWLTLKPADKAAFNTFSTVCVSCAANTHCADAILACAP